MKTLHIIATFVAICFAFSACNNNPNGTDKIDYAGISFEYPTRLSKETSELKDDVHYISCTEILSGELFTVSSFAYENENDYDNLMNSYFSYFKKFDKLIHDLSINELDSAKFANFNCHARSYSGTLYTKKIFGMVYSFKAGDRTILIVKQTSDDERKLDSRFKLIEETFKIANVDTDKKEDIAKENLQVE